MLFKEFLPEDWKLVLRERIDGKNILQLEQFLAREFASKNHIFPPKEEIFFALSSCKFDHVKVVIMGQDPYHGMGQAHGLSFSVKPGVPHPPSLRNIFKEMKQDVGAMVPDSGCLSFLADQGVLLLNATLTVREGEPKSHFGKGWEYFTDGIIEALAEREEPVVFVLWGKLAEDKCRHILEGKHGRCHHILTARHPSPLSAHRGFFGCRHFSKINDQLKEWGKSPIKWSAYSASISE